MTGDLSGSGNEVVEMYLLTNSTCQRTAKAFYA